MKKYYADGMNGQPEVNPIMIIIVLLKYTEVIDRAYQFKHNR